MTNRSVLLLAFLLSAAGRAQDAGAIVDGKGKVEAPAAAVVPAPSPEEWNNARELIDEAHEYVKEAAVATREEDNRCSAKLGAKLDAISDQLEQLRSGFDRRRLRKTIALTDDARELLKSDCPKSFARSAEKKLERVVTRLQRADAQIR